jgi:AcrR family transcriptional regulator
MDRPISEGSRKVIPTTAVHGRAGRTRTPSADIPRALVDAAEVVLQREGPNAVSVRAVATEAGVAPMGVYNHLGGKDGLIDALLVRGFDALRAAIAHRGELEPIQRLRASALRYREFALTRRPFYTLLFQHEMTRDNSSADVAEHASAAFAELLAHVATAMDAGLLRPADNTEVAQQIWSTMHGAVALELTAIGFTPNPEATYHALVETLLRGLLQPPPAGTAQPETGT